MPCWKPLTGYYSKVVGKTGKRLITFSRGESLTGVALKIPCGRCAGCRLENSRQWAMRCLHEKRLHKDSCYVTLTYDNVHLPAAGTLVKRDLQLFMKKVRNGRGQGIKFYGCGEYGELNRRPHYHVILFGVDFPDKRLHSHNRRGEPLYESEELSRYWSNGASILGAVTFDSCAYVARYVMKKVTGPLAADHYDVVDGDGVITARVPEFTLMSRGGRGKGSGGIGRGWFEKHGKESYAHDNCIIKGKPVSLPRYYDGRYELENREDLIRLKKARKRKATLQFKEGLVDRLRVRERHQMLTMKHFKREL